jgi:uncharacterized protein YbjT (DUF2867 family)
LIVAVTGGTGFTGEFVVRGLLEAGHRVRCLARPSADVSRLPQAAERVGGDLEDPASLRRLLGGAGALVNVSSLGRGHAGAVVNACRDSSVSRAVFFSTTSIFTKLPAKSREIRMEGERRVEESALAWTILRPTMIYGTERDRNMSRLIRFLARAPVVPLPGEGKALIQPVYVEDLARAVVSVLATPSTAMGAYNLPGREPTPLRDLVKFLIERLGRRTPILSVPLEPAARMAALWQKTGLPPRLKREQVLRLAEDKDFGFEEARRDFGYEPRSWREGLTLELKRLRDIGWVK